MLLGLNLCLVLSILTLQVKSECTQSNITLKNASLPPPLGYKKVSRAQMKEDLYLYENLFYQKTSGIILESGALDGLRFSSTYMLTHLFNWTAIHVEGSLHNYEKLATNRPESLNIHAVLCDEPRPPLHYLSHKGGGAISGIKEFMDLSFYYRYYRNESHYNVSMVECIPLNSLLDRLGICHLDVWILDVEGAENVVLKGIDLHRFHISVIVIETTSKNTSQNLRYIKSHGYVCKVMPGYQQFVSNQVCIRSDFQPSAQILTQGRLPSSQYKIQRTNPNPVTLIQRSKPNSAATA